MLRHRLHVLALAACAAMHAFATTAQAQAVTQVKPWFLLIVDTSSSMDACTTSPCGANDPLNSCGFRRNRLGDAKCAIQRIVASTGDAELSLLQYAHPCNAMCGDEDDGVCDAQLLVPLTESNQPSLYQWVDGVCQSNCTGTNYTREIRMGNNTPIAMSLERAHQYLAGTLPRTQVVGIANNAAPYPSPLANDPYVDCRPVSVIMLTDGAESCGGDPDMEAAQLFAAGTAPLGKRVRTYAIGFGVPEGDADIESLAMAGSTDAPGQYRGFYATNEQQLSIALNTIIANSQLPSEICNDRDDNCNDLIDEGIQKYCDPTDIEAGPTLCEEPDELLCDGVDDDCDGIVDEGLANACGVCGALPSETCNNTDDDCDGRVDEDVVTGEPCGTMEGSCQVGTTDCVNGAVVCVGQLVPGTEVCDCMDNDCDGFIDESFVGEGLCADGASCVDCSCQTLCIVTEFSELYCPDGFMPEVLDTGLCVCASSACKASECSQETQERDGEVVCAPDSERVTSCVCKTGNCVDACAGVTCEGEQVCDPRDSRGICKPNHCSVLGCVSDQLCNALSGECEADLCADKDCPTGQACRDGVCEPTCVGITCGNGQRCERGECVIERCPPRKCESDEACDPATGDCEAAETCDPVCIGTATCNRLTGECEESPCARVHCPPGSSCTAGECTGGGVINDAGLPPENVLATGGGGCSCSVASAQQDTRPSAWLVTLMTLAAIAWRIRRRQQGKAQRAKLWLGATLALSLLTVGCDVSPFCVANCDDPGQAVDGSVRDTGGSDDDSGGGGIGGGDNDSSVPTDAGGSGGVGGGPSNCREGTPEICNGVDEDCDFRVDEDAFEPTSTCDTRGVCTEDRWACAGSAGWVCRHGDGYQSDETLCDSLDNDCDGATDEGTPTLGDECGVGVGACRVTGEFVCHPSGVGTQCSLDEAGEPSAEICDGIDNDCDGTVDEPKSAPGTHASYVQQELVHIGNMWMYPYEASRPDATRNAQGTSNTRACSKRNVLPWTNLTYAEARAACQAANMDLCSEAQWQTACTDGPASTTCNWSFTTAANACGNLANTPTECNGEEYDSTAGGTDDDILLPTGSLTRCFAATAGGSVFDLSGNAKEFTLRRSSGVNPLRGGSYNNVAAGLRCDFNFTVVDNNFKFQNAGFRCCSTSDPN